MIPHGRPRRKAFTLVEIMVAMAVFSIVLAAIYSTWTAILRSSKTGLDAVAQVQRERMAIRTLEEALLCARSFALDVNHYTFLAENGDDATLSFVAKLPDSFPRGGRFGDFDVRRVTFSLERSQDFGRNLVLRQNPILMDLDEDEIQHPVVLARNVKEFKMQFWDMRLGDWIDEWQQTNQLPRLVAINLSIGAADPRVSGGEIEISRVVALPSIMVPQALQAPIIPAIPAVPPGGTGAVPGQPGVVPGQPGVVPGQPGTMPPGYQGNPLPTVPISPLPGRGGGTPR